MSSTIGGITVDFIRGLPQRLKTRVETWQVPGLDGYGARTFAQGDSEFEIRTVSWLTDNDSADSLITSALALQGTLIDSITDDWGTVYSNVLVVHIEVVNKTPMRWNNNANACRLELSWRCCST